MSGHVRRNRFSEDEGAKPVKSEPVPDPIEPTVSSEDPSPEAPLVSAVFGGADSAFDEFDGVGGIHDRVEAPRGPVAEEPKVVKAAPGVERPTRKGSAGERGAYAPELSTPKVGRLAEDKIDEVQAAIKKAARVAAQRAGEGALRAGSGLLERVRARAGARAAEKQGKGASLALRIRKGFYGAVIGSTLLFGGKAALSHIMHHGKMSTEASQSAWVLANATRADAGSTGAYREGERLAGRAIREELLQTLSAARERDDDAAKSAIIGILGVNVIEDADREDAHAIGRDYALVIQIFGENNPDVRVGSVLLGALQAEEMLHVKTSGPSWRERARAQKVIIEQGGNQAHFGGDMNQKIADEMRRAVENARIKTLGLRGKQAQGAAELFRKVTDALNLVAPAIARSR